jgi:hypothetical protein
MASHDSLTMIPAATIANATWIGSRRRCARGADGRGCRACCLEWQGAEVETAGASSSRHGCAHGTSTISHNIV